MKQQSLFQTIISQVILALVPLCSMKRWIPFVVRVKAVTLQCLLRKSHDDISELYGGCSTTFTKTSPTCSCKSSICGRTTFRNEIYQVQNAFVHCIVEIIAEDIIMCFLFPHFWCSSYTNVNNLAMWLMRLLCKKQKKKIQIGSFLLKLSWEYIKKKKMPWRNVYNLFVLSQLISYNHYL